MIKWLCIGVFMVFILLIMRKNKGMGSMYNGILIGGLLYYGVVPLIMELNKKSVAVKSNSFLYKDADEYAITYFMIMLFFFVFFISNNGYTYKRNYRYAPNEIKFGKYLKGFGYFCLIFGGGSLILFFGFLGGLSSALSIAERARSFSTSLTDFMPYYASLLVIPARLVTVAPFCFWCLRYLEGRKYRPHVVISFILSALFYLFNAGRAQILAMILCIVVPLMLNLKIRHAWRYIIIIGVLSLPLLDVLDQLFVYMQKGTFSLGTVNYLSYIKQFSYPINNVFHAFEIGDAYGYRFGQDFVTTILDFVPGLSFEPSYIPTSTFYGGETWRITGGTPNDLITLSILEFHIVGVIIVPWILGKISKFVDEFTRGCPDIRISRICSTMVAVYSFLMIQSADPSAVFRGFILWMIPLIMFLSRAKVENGDLK